MSKHPRIGLPGMMIRGPGDPAYYYDRGVAFKRDRRDPRIPDKIPSWAIMPAPTERVNDPTNDQEAFKYVEDFGWQRPFPVPPQTTGIWYPLATITVPRGLIGYIYQIQTLALGFQGDDTVPWYRRGDPIFYQTQLQARPIYWRITLEGRDPDAEPFALNPQFSPGPQPVHPDITTWSDGRFTWDAVNNRLKLFIPESNTAVLWGALDPNMQEQNRPTYIGGRLIGYTQQWVNNKTAVINTRASF